MESELKGFVVETPHAVLIDQGTSFGVNVDAGNFSEIEVWNLRFSCQHLLWPPESPLGDFTAFSDGQLAQGACPWTH